MSCPRCAAETPANASFCPQCGAALAERGAADLSASASGADAGAGRPVVAGGQGWRTRLIDEPEHDLWEGSYSPKAMLGVWLAMGLVTCLAILAGAIQLRSGRQWTGLLCALAVAWVVALLILLYRRIGVHYRLTTQRLFHERGVLRRTIDRIELIKMDDISCEQGLIERLLGIGSIRIKSSDRSDPDFWIRGVENARAIAIQIDRARRAEQIRRGILVETK